MKRRHRTVCEQGQSGRERTEASTRLCGRKVSKEQEMLHPTASNIRHFQRARKYVGEESAVNGADVTL
jgi:hypothetical protein